jgi:hypothetical protein
MKHPNRKTHEIGNPWRAPKYELNGVPEKHPPKMTLKLAEKTGRLKIVKRRK